jgi:hypothetical protein
LYDLTGNVSEWCEDWYHKDFYGKSPKSNSVGLPASEQRVSRGGSWFYKWTFALRVADREDIGPSERIPNVFFKMSRCCRSSAFSRRSAANSLSIEPCWVGMAGEYCLRHRYSRFSEIPSSWPTCRADLPLLSHKATASRLKAGSNFRRGLID